MPNERFQFTGSEGQQLAASLDLPEREPLAYALFAHCFTCGKDALAAKRIVAALAAKGIPVLRFDFTGIGSSEGISPTRPSPSVADLVWMPSICARPGKAPAILIGHSLGGAAILARPRIFGRQGRRHHRSPCRSGACHRPFADRIEDIRNHGEVEVSLAGRPFHIKREFLDDIAEYNLMDHVTKLHKALLIMHSPTDDTVGIDNATRIFVAAKHPEELRVAGRRRSPADPEKRFRLRRRCHRRLGHALPRSHRSRAGCRRR